jgi:hypothetical protein
MASYSPHHVMLTNLDPHHYVAGPDLVEPAEGDAVFVMAGRIMEFLSRRCDAETGFAGFNWSEYSYGAGLEEQGGFVSMTTKFHAHVWTRPAAPEEGKLAEFNDSRAEWVREEELSPQLYRLLVKNDYGALLGELFAAAAREAFIPGVGASRAVIEALMEPGNWSFDARGTCAAIAIPLLRVVRSPQLFSTVVQPIAKAVIGLLNCLAETFTDMRCAELRGILEKVESGPLSAADLTALRAVPRVRPEAEIKSSLRARGLPDELVPVLLPPISERCRNSGWADPSMMWRKGFGFAFCFAGAVDGDVCELRLMPGVYLGPGGVVEAHRIVLSRVPVSAPESELLRRGRLLQKLSQEVAA